jgi:hypothetical protein
MSISDTYRKIELEEIKRCIPFTGKRFEGIDAIDLLILLAKHKVNNDFEYACKCISESDNETFRRANQYMLEYIDDCRRKKQKCVNCHSGHSGHSDEFTDWHISTLKKYK